MRSFKTSSSSGKIKIMVIIEKNSFWSRYANKIVSSQIQLNLLFYFYVTASSAVVTLNLSSRPNVKLGTISRLVR